MARRATRALAAMLASVVLALPAVILTSHQPAAAAAVGQQADAAPVSIAITKMTPQWATSRSTITIKGTLHNNTTSPRGQLTVRLFASNTPVGDLTELQSAANQPSLANVQWGTATWQAPATLAPGKTMDWTIRAPASAIGMTTFGVYPVAAEVDQNQLGPLDHTTTFLPYQPSKKGRHAAATPQAKIAWLWPLIDVPLLNEPWQSNCLGSQASALAQSIGPNGRLGELARAGATDEDITWVIDPAVLANVRALTSCGRTKPQWAKAASAWLTDLRSYTSGRPVTVTPYGDPNAAALIFASQGLGYDVHRSFLLGRGVATQILGRHLYPAPTTGTTNGTTAPLTQAAGIAWSAAGVPGYTTLENLGPSDFVSTLVLNGSAFPDGQYSVVKTPDAIGYMTALLANQSLIQLLGSHSNGPGAAFTTSQLFLAETALLAQHQVPAQPIVVAPPRRWAPPAGLAASLLADTTAPWLSQTSLTSLASAKHIPIVANQSWPALWLGSTRFTRRELRRFRILDREINQLESIRAHLDPQMYLAISSLESSAFQGTSTGATDKMLATVAKRIVAQQQAVRIIAEKRITLGGLKGAVPVSIDNHLGYPVRVALKLVYSQADGVKITADPPGPVTIPARQTQTIHLRVQATTVGSTTVTMLLSTQYGNTVSVPLRMTIQATQVGTLGVIVFAAALGVFLVASAVRAVRRGRPGAGADQPADDAPTGDHDREGSADPAEADTVKSERAELGAVGKPAP